MGVSAGVVYFVETGTSLSPRVFAQYVHAIQSTITVLSKRSGDVSVKVFSRLIPKTIF